MVRSPRTTSERQRVRKRESGEKEEKNEAKEGKLSLIKLPAVRHSAAFCSPRNLFWIILPEETTGPSGHLEEAKSNWCCLGILSREILLIILLTKSAFCYDSDKIASSHAKNVLSN